jgi:membrane protein
MGDPDEADANAGDDADSDEYSGTDADTGTEASGAGAYDDLREDVSTVEAAIEDLREEIDGVETEMEERTVHREEIETDLKGYVRKRIRRGHARGWGPYLVLLYGTAMTIAAFVYLSGGWAILAMLVIWLSTLGLYTLMVLFGLAFSAFSVPGRAMEAARSLTDTLRKLRP